MKTNTFFKTILLFEFFYGIFGITLIGYIMGADGDTGYALGVLNLILMIMTLCTWLIVSIMEYISKKFKR